MERKEEKLEVFSRRSPLRKGPGNEGRDPLKFMKKKGESMGGGVYLLEKGEKLPFILRGSGGKKSLRRRKKKKIVDEWRARIPRGKTLAAGKGNEGKIPKDPEGPLENDAEGGSRGFFAGGRAFFS